jgi:phosphoserine phosphatase RsbU/P
MRHSSLSHPSDLRRRPGSLLSHVRNARPRRRPQPAAPDPQTLAAAAADAKRQAELEQELQLARDIQQGLLLEAVPHLRGWEISAISLPARDLGGDLYDFLPLGSDRHGLMIGDVSGKGLPAALRMAVARTVFRHEARGGNGPSTALAGVNRAVLREIPHGMVTMLYAQLDVAGGQIVFANAGHNYPLLIRGDRIEELEADGLPLGVDGDADYGELTTRLLPGQSVLLYTDGVVEAENPAGEIFGFEQLRVLLSEYRSMKPRAIIAALLHDLRTWQGASGATDDVTIVALRRRLSFLGDELRGIAQDVLGEESAAQLWLSLPLPDFDASPEVWAEQLPTILREAQARYGRGLARELNGQLRLAIDDYRAPNY